MTKILEADPIYGFDPTFPEDNVDPETASGLEPSIQEALNRAEHAKARLDFGVRRQHSVNTIAELKATTGQATGDHVVVKNLGVYQFDGASAETSNDIMIVTPTAGGGRWLHVNRLAIGAALGIAPLDTTQKVPVANLRGQVLSWVSLTIALASGTATSTPAQVGATMTQSLSVGQVWDFVFDISLAKIGAVSADYSKLTCKIEMPDTSTLLLPGARMYGGSESVVRVVGANGRIRATQNGTHTAKLEVSTHVGSSVDYQITGVIDRYVIAAP